MAVLHVPLQSNRIDTCSSLLSSSHRAMANEDGSYELSLLLSSEERDFLIRNNGDQVKVSSLVGKIVGFYFSGSWCGPCRNFTPLLVEVYEQLSSKGDFEVVFISSDEDDESFKTYFSKMPWLAIPFSDAVTRERLEEVFEVRGIPNLVILNSNGKVSCDAGVSSIMEHGVDGYPFSLDRLNFLKEQEENAKKNQTISSILVSSSRDYVISNDGKKIPLLDLEGKMVCLYFSIHYHRMCREFTPKLAELYKRLKEKGENFEVVLISLDHEENDFKESFETMPWLALPFKDKSCKKLVRYFELETIPTLVVIGQDGKTLNPDVAELIEDHGIEAYPFTPEKLDELAAIEKAKLESQTLESVLVDGEKDFVIDKSGSKVPVSGLVGKNILLYFSAQWCPPCRAFLPKLIEAYRTIKAKGSAFEVIFISSDTDQSTFDAFYTEMPWLALPFGDGRKRILTRKFKIEGIPAAVAIGPNGRTITKEARKHLTAYGADAFPFTEEHLKQLEEIEKTKLESQTLESILVYGENDFVIDKSGSKVPVSGLVGKNILLYFSAQWCSPCRAFLPKLIEAYRTIKAKGSAFEVIFISSDRDQSTFDEFYSEMPWLALPFGDGRKQILNKIFKIECIPAAVVIGPSGRTITKEARKHLTAYGADAFPFTEGHLKQLEEEIEKKARGWPEKVKHELHSEHELIRTKRSSYVCDGCGESGYGWSFYCKECDFDLHPKCALKEDEDSGTEKGKEEWICDGDVCRKA